MCDNEFHNSKIRVTLTEWEWRVLANALCDQIPGCPKLECADNADMFSKLNIMDSLGVQLATALIRMEG